MASYLLPSADYRFPYMPPIASAISSRVSSSGTRSAAMRSSDMRVSGAETEIAYEARPR